MIDKLCWSVELFSSLEAHGSYHHMGQHIDRHYRQIRKEWSLEW